MPIKLPKTEQNTSAVSTGSVTFTDNIDPLMVQSRSNSNTVESIAAPSPPSDQLDPLTAPTGFNGVDGAEQFGLIKPDTESKMVHEQNPVYNHDIVPNHDPSVYPSLNNSSDPSVVSHSTVVHTERIQCTNKSCKCDPCECIECYCEVCDACDCDPCVCDPCVNEPYDSDDETYYPKHKSYSFLNGLTKMNVALTLMAFTGVFYGLRMLRK
jgi:hypothetical protein